MALFDPTRTSAVDPRDAVLVVHGFLTRCIDWAHTREIGPRLDRVRDTLDPIEAGKLHAWVAWVRFCEHARREIEDGTLDAWFQEPPPDAP